jgi:hypothetical protein
VLVAVIDGVDPVPQPPVQLVQCQHDLG